MSCIIACRNRAAFLCCVQRASDAASCQVVVQRFFAASEWAPVAAMQMRTLAWQYVCFCGEQPLFVLELCSFSSVLLEASSIIGFERAEEGQATNLRLSVKSGCRGNLLTVTNQPRTAAAPITALLARTRGSTTIPIRSFTAFTRSCTIYKPVRACIRN